MTVLVALACSGGDSEPDAAEQGDAADAGTIDVGFEEHDVGMDATDVGSDAPLPPDDPGWERLPGFPDECFVERARQPEAVLAYHWEPCFDDMPACEMAIVDRSVAPLDRAVSLGGGNDARGVLVWHLRGDRDSPYSYLALARGGSVAVAWRSGPFADGSYCDASPVASAEGVGLEAWSAPRGGAYVGHVTIGPWDDLERLDAPVWNETRDVIPTGTFLQSFSVGGTTFAATVSNGRIVAVEPPRAAVLGTGSEPVVVGRSVLWNWSDATLATAIHISRIGGTETVLHVPPVGTHLYGVRSDGLWITWRGGIDDPTGVHFRLNELWAAPYRETAPLDARRLWTDLGQSGYNGTIGDAMFVYVTADETGTHAAIRVVDLADGSRRTYTVTTDFTSSQGWFLSGDAAWVTRDELAFPAHHIDGTALARTVLRIDLTGLPVEPLP